MKKTFTFVLLGLLMFAGFDVAVAQVSDAGARLASWDLHQKMTRESDFKDLNWKAVGPRLQGGRIETIACPPGETSTIYVGAGSGNLWKTENNGTTWKPIFEHESTFAIGAVAVAPSNPDIVWVGTGEVLMARSSYAGTGVFKSTDAGETWQNMGLPESHHIARVLIDPENPDVVYVAALGHLYSQNGEKGLYKTIDGGETWVKSLYVSEKVGVVEVIMDPTDNKTLFAVAWERSRKVSGHVPSGEGSAVYKSSDAGASWVKLTNGLPQGEQIGRFGLAIAPSNPNVIYALVDNRTPMGENDRPIGGELFRSEDKGESWHQVSEERLPTAIGYDFCLIRVLPDDEDQIFILGNYLLYSKDGGKTYERNEGKLVHLLPHGSKVIHLDQHEMWIDPANADRVLLGNDGGFHISYDRGESWLHYNNMPIGEFYAVSVDMAEPYNIYGGNQDNAALFGPATEIADDEPEAWKQVYIDRWGGGDSYFTWVDPTDADIIYYEHQFGYMRRKNMKTGETATIQPRAKEGEPEYRYNWMTPFFISKYNPYTVYYAANVVLKSVDKGDNWSVISPDLTTNPAVQGNVPFGTITSMSESPMAMGTLYVGADDGSIYRTRDDGKSWQQINDGLPTKWVSRILASQHDKATVYLSYTGYRDDDFEKYLYMSTDYGDTWKSIAGNLPAEAINVIGEDPKSPSILYVGTDLGVYVSLDSGQNWQSICSNLPTTPVHDLVVHPRENELVIATHGRSMFVLDVKPIQEKVAK